jgi:Flp pilus assembly CpaE family ATPase
MSDSAVLKAVKSAIQDYATMEPSELVGRLRDPELIKKMKRFGVNDAQIHRVILILKEHRPSSKEFSAYLNSKLV